MVASLVFLPGLLVAEAGASDPAFDKPVPETLDDLRAIQAAVERVTAAAAPATVALNLGFSGTGSGVVVSEDGYILTAAHVIGDANQTIQVVFPDGQVHTAKTLGSDTQNDAGLAKLDGDGPWPFVPVADEDAPDVGEWVVALGHPGGFDADRPVVVRLGRVVRVRPLVGIQSDCSLIGGDSGGPLFNLDGEVVGIHSRIGHSARTNIHVAVGDYKAAWDGLAAGRQWGERRFPILGVVLGSDPDDRGVFVVQVLRGSPAADAGLRRGDVILSIDGAEVRDSRAVADHMALQVPGDVVRVRVLRGTRELTFDAELGEVR
ncbi:MAG: trypsin-like peptidase domain-containing protein [Planctomycetota bacterium]